MIFDSSFIETPSGSVDEKSFWIGVSMPPGAMQFTVMPRRRYSSARARLRFTTPPFDAQYAAQYGWPINPASDAIVTIRPPPSSRYGIAAWHVRNVPDRFTLMMRC